MSSVDHRGKLIARSLGPTLSHLTMLLENLDERQGSTSSYDLQGKAGAIPELSSDGKLLTLGRDMPGSGCGVDSLDSVRLAEYREDRELQSYCPDGVVV